MTTDIKDQLNSNGNGIMASRDKVVISGMSGLYPNSYNVSDLSDILYNKTNSSKKTDYWKFNHPELAQYKGNVPDLENFDAQFFKVHYRLGVNMDPMSRKLLEQAYQAIYDAGVNPESLSNKKVGVYIGVSDPETEKSLFYSNGATGFALTGCCRTMFANRISYSLNLKGPSMTVDKACCSSTAALELAYKAIARGDCEAAIVGGAYICLHPQSSIHRSRIIKLSQNGKTKSFDKNAAGCVLSEAINIIFLQKAKDALRVYSELVHISCEYIGMAKTEVGPKYGFYRNPTDHINFLSTFYKDANISPQAVQYVDSFGSATPDADKSELEVIDEVFCKTRNKPLLVGSVMSNLGYASSASGITAITKVLLGYYYGKLAGNLHCDSPREDVPALKEGRIKILQEHTEFDCTYAAVNNLSLTGVNAHVLLHGQYKPKDINRYKANIPRIVLLSGRQESAVKRIINDLKSRPIDPEEHALLHNIHETRISGHLGRGFAIFDTDDQNETVTLCEESNYFDQGKRPLWFVYSGMGSQWVGMGKELMRIPIFSAAIERCHRILEPKGLNIVDIITSDDKKVLDKILHSFVGIAAIQIGLTDVLRELDIHPDMIIGHSLGEIGCAYADGCFTAEETILCAYYRGLVSMQTPLIRGSMAAVGLGHKEISNLCPPEIEVACHNSPESSTISGPAEIMSKFVNELTSKGYFAKEVPCSNIAYHSRYIADAGPSMFKYLSEVITSPKLRSARWISTSVPENKWDEPSAKYSSAEYHTNNLLKPVLLEETLNLIPFNAVLIEIAPHGLLQAILKRSLPESCRLLPLTRRDHPNNTLFLLEAIGRLSAEGFHPKVKALYPKIEFPVSTSTPMLSHLVDWAHHEKWGLYLYTSANKATAAGSTQILSIHDDEHNYLRGHVIRGQIVYPHTAALVSVWDTLAMSLNVKPKCLSVEFRNVCLHSQPLLHDQRQLQISVSLQRGTGQFEVLNDKSLILRGTILADISTTRKSTSSSNTQMNIGSEEIYQLLHTRDYNYMGEFCSLHSVNETLTGGLIEWKDNWVTFIDAIVQLNMLRRKHNSVSRLSFIRQLVIDVDKQMTIKPIQKNDVTLYNVNVLEEFKSTMCGGVILEDPEFVDLPILTDNRIALKTLKLVPTINAKNNAEYYLPLEDEVDTGSEEMMKIVNIGDPTSLYWVKGVHNSTAGADVDVKYAGVNIVYSNRLLGINLTKKTVLKNVIDFSGITKSGARVMGIVESDTITSKLTANFEFLWPVPAHWSLEDAATVPLAYSMAFYILFIRSQLRPNHVVCVNGGGAGALGQAVITIALAHGCEVFASVSNKDKKKFLLKVFPQLKDDHIGFSNNLSFIDMILLSTKGKGCDIIISNAKEGYNNMFGKCLSITGIYFDTSLIQTGEDYKLGMSCLEKESGYVAVDFTSVFQQKYSSNAKSLQTMMSEGITQGYVRPLTRITFAPKDAYRAFHLQASQHNRGRVLLDLQKLESNSLPRLICSPSPWQLLISDNELLTLKLAERLLEQGAKKLVLFINNPSKCVHVQSRLWQENGIEIKLISDDIIFNENNVFNVIQQCKKHNGLESVFIVLSNESSLQYNKIGQTFAGIVKKSRISLKYFALVSTGNVDSVQTSETGMTNPQIITEIKLPEIQSRELISKNITALSINNAIYVLERLLCYKQSTILVQAYPAPKTSLLQQLSKLTDFKQENVLKNTMLDKNLGEININHSNLLAIQVHLRDLYGVYLSLEDIKLLTVKSINELEKECIGHEIIENQGISSYFCNSDTDELLSTTDIVYLQTLLSSNQGTFEVDIKKNHLYIVPGVEGHHSRFHEMCKRLKVPALVLQPGLDHSNETVHDRAKRYVDIMLQKTKLKNKFYLLGYESGVWIALEMAAILEEKGITGTVYCLGGSPAEILANFIENLSIYKTDEHLQMAVIKHIYSLMIDEDPNVLDTLCNLEWHEKVDACVQKLRGRVPHSIQYAKKFFETTYYRLTSALQYNLQHKVLQSQVISLHPKYLTSTDASLQNYSKQKIISYQLQTPLSHATQDLRCASIINRHLDSDILKDFKNSNKCEIYYIDSDKMIASVSAD